MPEATTAAPSAPATPAPSAPAPAPSGGGAAGGGATPPSSASGGAAGAKPAAGSADAGKGRANALKVGDTMSSAWDALEQFAEKPEGSTTATKEGKGPEKGDKFGNAPAKPEETAAKPGTLRANYDLLKKELATAQTRLKELESGGGAEAGKKAAEAEQRAAKLQTDLEAREQRLAAYEEKMRLVDYGQSTDYKEKYEAPYLSAYEEGQNWTAQLTVAPDGETPRKATTEDFDAAIRVYAQSPQEGAKLLRDWFGDNAASVEYKILDALKLNQVRVKALDAAKKNAGEFLKTQREQHGRAQAERDAAWKQENAAAREKYPQWFAEADGDEKGNELLHQGFSLADAAFGGPIQDPMTKQMRAPTPAELVKIHAAVRNRAAGFGRLVQREQVLREQVKALRAELDAYKASEPSGGDKRGKMKPATSGQTMMEQALGELERDYANK